MASPEEAEIEAGQAWNNIVTTIEDNYGLNPDTIQFQDQGQLETFDTKISGLTKALELEDPFSETSNASYYYDLDGLIAGSEAMLNELRNAERSWKSKPGATRARKPVSTSARAVSTRGQ